MAALYTLAVHSTQVADLWYLLDWPIAALRSLILCHTFRWKPASWPALAMTPAVLLGGETHSCACLGVCNQLTTACHSKSRPPRPTSSLHNHWQCMHAALLSCLESQPGPAATCCSCPNDDLLDDLLLASGPIHVPPEQLQQFWGFDCIAPAGWLCLHKQRLAVCRNPATAVFL